MENIYYPIDAVVTDIKENTPTIKTFQFKLSNKLTFRAGQFMQLTIPGIGEAPFTPSSSPGKVSEVEITVLRTGRVTDALHDDVKVDDRLGLRGPFGKGYPLEKFVGKEILIVGGGVGLAPLRSLIYAIFNRIDDFEKISICYGAKTPEDLCFRDEFDKWSKKPKTSLKLTIDNSHPEWDGTVGLVTCLLEKELIDVNIEKSYAILCGPEIMLKFVTLKLSEIGYTPKQIYLSMNRRMSCGFGKCARCNIGPYYLCKDGPDMCYDDIKDYPNVFP